MLGSFQPQKHQHLCYKSLIKSIIRQWLNVEPQTCSPVHRSIFKLPCKTLTATILDALFGSFLSRSPVSNTSIPARLLRVALWTTPNAPRPSSSSYSICSGSISHLSRGTIWRCEPAVLEENQQLILQIQLNTFLVFLFC